MLSPSKSTDSATQPALPSKRDQRRIARERFKRVHKAELAFGRKLRAVARQVGAIVKGLAPEGVPRSMPELNRALEKYSDLLRPWAELTAKGLVAEVSRRDARAWTEMGQEIGREIHNEIVRAPTGRKLHQIMAEQVDLITSLPREAAQRVHKLVIEGISNSVRAKEVAKEILRTGKVTESRAMLIARTETTRAATAMVEARALHIGSEGYFWRTAEDSDVRPIHRKLNGKFFKWSDPPVAGEKGERAHPGEMYNCRCYPEPVIPDDL